MTLIPRIKINHHRHLKQHFRVHALLNDFELEDVCRVQVALTSNQTLGLFTEHFLESIDKITDKGVAGFLIKLRLLLGKLFTRA